MSDKPSERKRQQALRVNEARFAGIINSAMDAIISIDQEQKITLFNPAAERIFGYKAADVLGKPVDILIPPQYREGHRRDVERFGETGVTSRSMTSPGQLTGLRSDGETFPIEATISQLEEGGERIFTVILRDTSERVKAHRETVRHLKLIAELSTPVLPVRPGLLVVPLIGAIDDERIDQLNRQLLGRIRQDRARAVVIDITGVATVDTYVANRLIRTARAARLLGAEPILTGISRQITSTLVKLGLSWGDIATEADLETGIDRALTVLQSRRPIRLAA